MHLSKVHIEFWQGRDVPRWAAGVQHAARRRYGPYSPARPSPVDLRRVLLHACVNAHADPRYWEAPAYRDVDAANLVSIVREAQRFGCDVRAALRPYAVGAAGFSRCAPRARRWLRRLGEAWAPLPRPPRA